MHFTPSLGKEEYRRSRPIYVLLEKLYRNKTSRKEDLSTAIFLKLGKVYPEDMKSLFLLYNRSLVLY